MNREQCLKETDRGEAVAISVAAQKFPCSRRGLHPTVSTLKRWASEGVDLRNGNPRIYLETIRVGSRHYTTLPAIQRFIEALNGPAGSSPSGKNTA
ncbi:MAG: DUF1580 domain-containing protein [Gemmataceae bacterium]